MITRMWRALQLLSRYDDHAVHFETATFSR